MQTQKKIQFLFVILLISTGCLGNNLKPEFAPHSPLEDPLEEIPLLVVIPHQRNVMTHSDYREEYIALRAEVTRLSDRYHQEIQSVSSVSDTVMEKVENYNTLLEQYNQEDLGKEEQLEILYTAVEQLEELLYLLQNKEEEFASPAVAEYTENQNFNSRAGVKDTHFVKAIPVAFRTPNRQYEQKLSENTPQTRFQIVPKKPFSPNPRPSHAAHPSLSRGKSALNTPDMVGRHYIVASSENRYSTRSDAKKPVDYTKTRKAENKHTKEQHYHTITNNLYTAESELARVPAGKTSVAEDVDPAPPPVEEADSDEHHRPVLFGYFTYGDMLSAAISTIFGILFLAA